MAGPFCALWAQDRRAAAHSGGPRPSRPASASVRPRSGRGPAGGPHGPGLGQPSPHAARAAWCCWRQGRGWGLPSAPSGRVPPAPSACGPHPCPPWAAWAPPAPPACGGRGIVAAGRRLRRLRPSQPPAVARGHPVGPQGQAPFGGAARPCPPPAPRRSRRRCSGPPRPHSWGLLGRCGPPAREGQAPASRPALARLRLCLRWCGSASAWPSRRSGPAPLRRPAAEPRGGVRALWARPVRGRNFYAAR